MSSLQPYVAGISINHQAGELRRDADEQRLASEARRPSPGNRGRVSDGLVARLARAIAAHLPVPRTGGQSA